jgi:Flp pilus assembly protein TadD
MGQFEAGVSAMRRALVLDPLASTAYTDFGLALYAARRYEEALTAFAAVINLDPDDERTYAERGLAYYGLGDLQSARLSCETHPDDWESQQCLAIVYEKLSRHADAEAQLSKLKATGGDTNSTPRSMRSGEIRRRRSNGSRRRGGCATPVWSTSRPTHSWTPCAKSRAFKR